MTDMKGVNIPLPTTVIEHIESEKGLGHIDLAFVQVLMCSVLPPDKAASVNEVLQNVAVSMNTLAALAQVTEQLAQEAIAQRDAAMDQRSRAVHELEHLTQAIQQIDQTNPDIAALVRAVWDAAQADMIQQPDTRKEE